MIQTQDIERLLHTVFDNDAQDSDAILALLKQLQRYERDEDIFTILKFASLKNPKFISEHLLFKIDGIDIIENEITSLSDIKSIDSIVSRYFHYRLPKIYLHKPIKIKLHWDERIARAIAIECAETLFPLCQGSVFDEHASICINTAKKFLYGELNVDKLWEISDGEASIFYPHIKDQSGLSDTLKTNISASHAYHAAQCAAAAPYPPNEEYSDPVWKIFDPQDWNASITPCSLRLALHHTKKAIQLQTHNIINIPDVDAWQRQKFLSYLFGEACVSDSPYASSPINGFT